MSAWQLRPRDTLVLSDGRPLQTGLSAPNSLDLPWPSSLVGMFTTALGRDQEGVFTPSKTEARELHSSLQVRGPLLIAHEEGRGDELLVPCPRDTLWLRLDDAHASQSAPRFGRYRLVPESLLTPDEERTQHLLSAYHDFEGHEGGAPSLLYPRVEPPRGKLSAPFKYWRWSHLERWLCHPTDAETLTQHQWLEQYVGALPQEHRTHVALSSSLAEEDAERTRGALEGHLFGVRGQRYQARSTQGALQRYSLWASMHSEHAIAQEATLEGWAHLGGERRLIELKKADVNTPTMSDELAERLSAQRLVKVILLTPALFDQGDHPTELLQGGHKLIAQLVDRPQPLSGWDLQKQRPRRARRMAPAGSVYWIELAEGTDTTAWARERFMTCISDQVEDSRQGFGLCVIGLP